MRPASPRMAELLASELSAFVLCWRVVRRDGIALGFTSHDEPFEFDGVHYRSSPGLQPSAIELGDGDASDAMEMAGALTDDAVRRDDIERGRWDGAQVETFLIDWTEPEAGVLTLAFGHLGEIEWRDGEFKAQLRTSLTDFSSVPIEVYSPECRAELGDARCRVNLAPLTTVRVIETVAGGEWRVDGPDLGEANDFRYGRARVLTGLAAGEHRAIRGSTIDSVAVGKPVEGVARGSLVELRAGCDKRFATCHRRFGNALNFRGEPYLPGSDDVARYGGL